VVFSRKVLNIMSFSCYIYMIDSLWFMDVNKKNIDSY
jgi:hypothetical protein